MKRNWMVKGLKIALFATLLVVVLGFVVMSLWNSLMPALFGWHLISFWQAVGLLLLSKILFGGFRGGPGRHRYWRQRIKERWEHLTPEEREKFLQGMRGRCGSFVPPVAEPKV